MSVTQPDIDKVELENRLTDAFSDAIAGGIPPEECKDAIGNAMQRAIDRWQ